MKLVFIFLSLWSSNAFAYLDPGTGSIILQASIAAIITAFYAVKTYWYIIKHYLSSKFSFFKKTASKDNE